MKKKFDCVGMKHLGAEKVYEKISGMTRAQELIFWQKQSQHLQKRQEAVKNRQKKVEAKVCHERT